MHPQTIARVERFGGFVIIGPSLHPSLALHPLHPATKRAISISLYEDSRSIHMSLTPEQAAELIDKLQALIPTEL